MSDHKPDWYERADGGPFHEPSFTPEMKERVRKKLAGRTPLKKRRTFVPVFAAGVLCAAVIVFLWPGPRPPVMTDPNTTAVHQELPGDRSGVVRAEGSSGQGTIRVVAQGAERIERLGAPSCIGAETDYSFAGSYRILYILPNGEETELGTWDEMRFIQPATDPVEMTKLSFQDADVFLLAPQYQDCHAIEVYAFAVDAHSGEAYPLKFKENGETRETSYYRPLSAPKVNNQHLVLESSEGPGGEGAPDFQPERKYRLDLREQVLILE